MAPRTIHTVTLSENGAVLATDTAYATNSGLEKGRGLLRTIARTTGEPFESVTGQGSFTRATGSRSIWQGERTGRLILMTVQSAEQALEGATHDTIEGV